jgi:XTP/dITP diphosphohydrolase
MDIIFATKNKGKLKEVKAILEGYNVMGMEEAGIEIDVIEDGETFEDNAIKKAKEIMLISNKIVLADDSGIEIDYLDKKPGVHSARFLGEDTPYAIKNQKVLEMLESAKKEERTARYVAVIAAAFPDGTVLTERGIMEGEIAQEPKGENGFGYDPIFYIPEYKLTVAEMEPAEKNKISHRGIALRAIKKRLDEKIS